MASIARTAQYVPSKRDAAPGSIIGPLGRWQFTYPVDQDPLVSSRRKLIYRGVYEGIAHQGPVNARALVFDVREVASFGIECGNLSRLASLGVGPKLLAVTQHDFEMLGGSRPTILEEDAGESLAYLLVRGGVDEAEPILHPVGTPERALENQKILYDVFVQMRNAHKAGIYHRDLRCENVCVRRFGAQPADIRATIIDFDLGTTQMSGEPEARASLFRTLFSLIPSYLTGGQTVLKPNAMELDMAYLAALQYHVERGDLLLNGEEPPVATLEDFLRYLSEHVDYFAYRGGNPPYARRIDTAFDLARLAKALGLTSVSAKTFPSRQLLEYARSFHKPYLDAEDLGACMRGPQARLAEMIDDIVAAEFESYKALRRAQGKPVDYERFDQQPMSLQRSNYAQAEHISTKVFALGYLLASTYDPDVYEEITALSDEQIETLARLEHDRWIQERTAEGWTFGPERDALKRTSPYLVAYDELTDDVKEYDRAPARELIGIVNQAGLKVVRPK